MPGRHFLQIPGPSNIPARVLKAMDRPVINHRGENFAVITKDIFPKLKQVFKTGQGTPIVFPSSGTGAWEASLVNTLSPGDAVLAFVIGHFSGEYAQAAQNLGYAVERVELPWGSGISGEQVYEELSKDKAHRFKAVLTIHNETSTGVMTDLKSIREAMDRAGHPALLLVDSVSGLGSLDLRFDEWGLDVLVTCSQKGLLLPPGLGLLCVSEKALLAYQAAQTPKHYFDWGAMLEKNPAGFFPYTPASQLLFGLNEALDMLLEEGLEQVFARHARYAEGVRRAVRAWGLKILAAKPEEASNVLATVMLPEGVDSNALIEYTEREIELALGNGLGPLNGRAFRIGHLGDLNELEVLATLAGTEMGMRAMGMNIPLGSGVAACQEWFLDGR
ncbi:MAG: aminotransferase class V-fold PLP-dependent enzyme [SAR324 cluster bacterium]|nr:aminotransferase class V-fold PLP-dependent enzyme [SAR324 cluster bacterium]